MNINKIELDKYITNEPINNIGLYCEEIYENFSDKFYSEVYEKNNKFETSYLEDNWLNKLYNKKIKPYKASQIIERAYKLYNVN